MPQSVKEKPLLKLSTAVEKTAKVDIDGTEYDVLGATHLGKDQEITLLALYKEHDIISEKMQSTKDRRKMENLAGEQWALRIEMITEFTSIPKETAKKLPLNAANQLVDIIAREMKLVGDWTPVLAACARADWDEAPDDIQEAITKVLEWLGDQVQRKPGRAEGN